VANPEQDRPKDNARNERYQPVGDAAKTASDALGYRNEGESLQGTEQREPEKRAAILAVYPH
jgi:hypothetical protein